MPLEQRVDAKLLSLLARQSLHLLNSGDRADPSRVDYPQESRPIQPEVFLLVVFPS